MESVTSTVHWGAFTLFVLCTAYLSAQEYGNARESWNQVVLAREHRNNNNHNAYASSSSTTSAQDEAEEEAEEREAWQEEEQNARKVLKVGEAVVHSDLGRGRVVESNALHREYVLADFDILNEPRRVDLHKLLFLGMRLRHLTRGQGTLVLFDEDERAHVRFDSGEYHRYLFSSWDRKMASRTNTGITAHHHHHHAATTTRRRQPFQRFFKDYLLYRIDYLLSTFTFAKPLVLFACTYTLIIAGASAYSLASDKSWLESMWIAWTMVADPGTHTSEEEFGQRVVALALSLGGMLVFALMIGIIADGVSSLLDELKQGHSFVIESGHTLVLGWSDKTLPFVREICLANESEGGRVIVILADRAKVDMETELQLTREESRGTLIICRSGKPTLRSDLRKVSAGSARSVVILAADRSAMDADESDAHAVRCVLALQGVRTATTTSTSGHIVVEMCNMDNKDLAVLADHHRGSVEIVVAHDLVGRLMIQCAREPGLAHIIDQLIGFEGDEFYMRAWPELTGVHFGEVLFRFEDAIPLGVKPADRADAYEQIRRSQWRKESLVRRDWDGALRTTTPDNGDGGDSGDDASSVSSSSSSSLSVSSLGDAYISARVMLNPPNDYVMRAGDELVVLAQDDDTYSAKPFTKLPKSALASFSEMKPCHRPICQTRAEKFLVCGWRKDMDDMLLELDQLVGRGSEVTIMCTTPEEERVWRLRPGTPDFALLRNLSIHHVVGNPFLRKDLNRLKHQLCYFGSVLILADQSQTGGDVPSAADGRSLASLLLLRDMISKQLLARQMGGGAPLMSSSASRRLLVPPQPEHLGSTDNGGGSFRANLALEMALESGAVGLTTSSSTPSPALPHPSSSSSPLSPGSSSPSLSPGSAPPRSTSKRHMLSRGGSSGASTRFTSSSLSESKRHLLLSSQHQHSSRQLGDKFVVKRQSSVGAALYFENAHHTGNTVLISELLDTRTKSLIRVANVGEHVMSNEIVAATLAMVSECRDINTILSELLRAEGNDLHLRSALDYGRVGEKIDFWQLQSRARARGEICLGYRGMSDKEATLNPREKCSKFTLHPRAMVIVISED